MTLPVFERVFTGFLDVETMQPYDLEDGAADAIERFEHGFLSGLAGDDLPPEALEKATAEARALVDTLASAVRQFVVAIMPPEIATENSDYIVEQAHGARLPLDMQIARLETGTDTDADEAVNFRLLNTTLEQNYQALLDHLTAARVAEEMDTPTYIERLRGAFKRARDGSRAQETKLQIHIDRAQVIAARLSVVAAITRFLRMQVIPKLQTAEDDTAGEPRALEIALSELEGFVARTQAFADHFRNFLALACNSLIRVRRDFTAQANMAGAEGESILVSRDIERHAFFRPLPFLWALFITVLVKIVLAHNTSESLHFLAVPILLLSFVLTWTLSIYIGVWARSRRMKELQSHVRQQLRHVLMADNADEELVEFPRIPAKHAAPAHKPLTPFPYRGHAARHKGTVMRRNLLALSIPVVLGVVVLITRDDAEHDFIARFSNAEPCVLASGRMVFATRNSYFVQSRSIDHDPFDWALSRVFPELLADVIDRADIIRVGSGLAAPSRTSPQAEQAEQRDLPDCVTSGPIRGGAGDGQMAAVTVHLGDTSLEVLTQAVAGGAHPPANVIDAIIVDARRTIALELSKPDPADINLPVILTALNDIRNHVDTEITIQQALGIAFGGEPSAPSRLELPDTLLAFLDGENGPGGLLGELRALRLALENTNTIAASIATTVELDQSDDAMVAILDQRLAAIIEQQDSLRVALTQTLAARGGDAVIVAPAVFDRAQGPGGNPGDGEVSAHFFQTTISLTGSGDALNTLENTLVLPFFTTPVESGDGGLETPQGAFDWGADTRYMNDPVVTADGTSYFGRIAQTLESCLIGNATVEVDLIGLASPSWDGSIGASSAETLNYYLAEGRRVGAMRRLGELMDEAAQQRVRVQIADGSSVPMSELIEALGDVAGVDALLPRLGRFESQSTFATRRDTLLGVAGLDPDKESPLEELFARSVVLRMVRTEGGPCQF